MLIEEIKQELIEQGKTPDDFNIKITEDVYSITPKWFYESKQIAKEQDKPIKANIEILNTENADLWYENIMTSSKLTTTEKEIADIWYEIIMGGM